jgi:hypothetical protein
VAFTDNPPPPAIDRSAVRSAHSLPRFGACIGKTLFTISDVAEVFFAFRIPAARRVNAWVASGGPM